MPNIAKMSQNGLKIKSHLVITTLIVSWKFEVSTIFLFKLQRKIEIQKSLFRKISQFFFGVFHIPTYSIKKNSKKISFFIMHLEYSIYF